MTLTEHALRGSVIVSGPRNRVAVGLPWFRSMPLSSVVSADLRLGGEPAADVGLEVDGRVVPVGRLAGLVDRYWFLQDRRVLTWTAPLPLGADEIEMVLRLRLHLPFLTGPDGGSVQVLQEVRGVVPIERSA